MHHNLQVSAPGPDAASPALTLCEFAPAAVDSFAEREDEIEGDVGPLPTDVLSRLNGNSAEKIAELEKEYDFTGVPLVYRDKAKKWQGLTVPLLRASGSRRIPRFCLPTILG